MPRRRRSPRSVSSTNKATVKHLVTYDLVLDVYERAKEETDPEARKAIIATAEVLSKSVGQYLVNIEI